MRPSEGVRQLFCLAFALALAGLALFAAVAPAATKTERPLLFSFDAGLRSAETIAVDHESGAVYVTEGDAAGANLATEPLSLKKFHADGTPWNFAATGTNSLPVYSRASGVAVDNSGGPMQGEIYLAEPQNQKVLSSESNQLVAFDPDGTVRWRTAVPSTSKTAVDAAGNLWTFGQGSTSVHEYDPSTTPPTEIGSVNVGETYLLGGDLDSAGALYVPRLIGAGYTLQKWVNGAFDSNFTAGASYHNRLRGVSIDQSSAAGHIFVSHQDSVSEFEPNATKVEDFGGGAIGGNDLETTSLEVRSIAYDNALDRVYVLAGRQGPNSTVGAKPKVFVFGAQQSGTEAVVTENAASAVGISSAHLSGAVNPENTSVEWHFEWKQPIQSWAAAGSSAAQSLPTDANSHEVELDTHALRGNTTYQVRLVAVDTATHLASYSSAVELTTGAASAAPAVTIAAPSNLTATSAKISGTVNPEGDTADWNVQLSKGAGCAGSFVNQSLQQIEEGTSSPVAVEATLNGLLPSESYCARLVATNSAGTTTSETKEFETGEVQPTQIFAAFAAPRTDTTARINGYVNPEGSQIAYRFEYSSDGGATWTPLPEGEDISEARSQIVVSAELTGLQPQSTYSFRLTAENPTGGETSVPLSFSTRSTAEVTLPTRGDELVNSSDKGTQNVRGPESIMGESPISADGEKALWAVFAGAPGGYNSAHDLFLAERSPSGWVSRSVQPPHSAQVGNGALAYTLNAFTPDLSKFVMSAVRSEVLGHPQKSTMVRLDDAQNQDVLREESANFENRNVDLTEDGKHVLVIANDQGQLVDIGSGSAEVVSIMPDGTEAECPLVNGRSFTGGQASGTPSGPGRVWLPGYHLINIHDASIVYFEAHPNGECGAQPHLYVRDRNAGVTTLIDPGANKGEVEFMRTTPSGRYGYFATYSRLDPADINTGRDIYRWDNETGESTCLTCVAENANVEDSVISDDFSRIYFQSENQLVAGKGTEGASNLYLLEEGTLSFVAQANFSGFGISETVLSADGADLLFAAKASPSLTSDAVGTPTGCHYVQKYEEEEAGVPDSQCDELYRYEADRHAIQCVSCARGSTTTYPVGSPTAGGHFNYRMSADGTTVAFATKQQLLPADVNRNTDVYEWHNGSIRLVTDGVTTFQEGGAAPQVNAVDRDGTNIFFSVVERGLTGYEHDELLNLYDARVGGGFPRPTTPANCSEDSCQGPLRAAPVQSRPGSSSLSGAGNVKSARSKARCRKGKVRRRGRCVRRRHAKRRHRHHRHAHRGRARHSQRGGSK